MASKYHMHTHRWGTISNGLTIFRLLASPVIAILLYQAAWWNAMVLFVVASFTDLLDGYCARAFNQQTWLGTILDPLADKCLLLSTFGALTFFHVPLFHIPVWFFVVVLGREICMVVGSVVAMLFFKNISVSPTWSGKATTMLHMIFLAWIFICYFMQWLPQKTYGCFLMFLAFFSLFSFVHYVYRLIFELRKNKR